MPGNGIAPYMSGLISEYNKIRFLPSRGSLDFWDVVVLTACNEEQKEAYEQMVKCRLGSSNPLPSFVDYVVIPDPPGPKVGNGGSTLHTLHELERKYGDKLFTLRVLLLHCGGQSQRLPCTSILGKVFAPVPTGQPIFDFIDIKLCNYLPFLKNMKPGVFLVSSDDIQPFCLKDSSLPDECAFTKSGFTVLAHPSSLEIGTKHGVYVLSTDKQFDKYASLAPVIRVLQKPTVATMRFANAILKQENGSEFCYSDSAFFFCHQISKKLVKFYHDVMPLSCEVDAYGDFLQCLGPLGTPDYVTDDRNVSNVSSSIQQTRLRVFELLHDEQICALLLPQSAYVHFGTMPEYINNMVDPDYVLSKAHSSTPGLRHYFEPFNPNASILTLVDSYMHSAFSAKVPACLMRSVIGPFVNIEAPCVVIEYSILTSKLTLGSECILSHCFFRKSNEHLHIPSGLFIYTIAVRGGFFSTVAFGIYDDLKYGAPGRNLKYLNGKVSIGKLAESYRMSVDLDAKLNLWTAKLFTLHKTPDEAFARTVKFVNDALILEQNFHENQQQQKDAFFSINDLLSNKDIPEIIKLRQSTSF